MKHSKITLMVLAVLATIGCQKTGTKTITVNVKVDEEKVVAAGITAPESYDVRYPTSLPELQSKPRPRTESPPLRISFREYIRCQ